MKRLLVILLWFAVCFWPLLLYGDQTNALALPCNTWSKTKQYLELEAFIKACYPYHEIILINEKEKLMNNWTLHTPIIFEGLRVYLRPKPERRSA